MAIVNDVDLELKDVGLCSLIYEQDEIANYERTIKRMRERGDWVPAYHSRFEGVVDGVHKIVERVEFFTPIQFRSVTRTPWPECATARNCQALIDYWNRVPGYTYKLV